MNRLTRRSRVTIEGADALTIREARALIRAAMAGRFSLAPGEAGLVLSACEKVAEGLIGAGQEREKVASLLDDPATSKISPAPPPAAGPGGDE